MTPKDFLNFIGQLDAQIAPGLGRATQQARTILVTAFANKLGEEKMFELIKEQARIQPDFDGYGNTVSILGDMCEWVTSPSKDFVVKLATLGSSRVNEYLKQYDEYREVARLLKMREDMYDYTSINNMAPYSPAELQALYEWGCQSIQSSIMKAPQTQLGTLARCKPDDGLVFNTRFIIDYHSVISADTLSSLDVRLPTLISLIEDTATTKKEKAKQLHVLLTSPVNSIEKVIIPEGDFSQSLGN